MGPALEAPGAGSYVAPTCGGRPIALFLGIDVGGTKTALALGDGEGRILARERLATPHTGDAKADLRTVAERARALLSRAGVALDRVAAVGVSAPGALDAERSVVLQPPNLPGWDRAPVRAVLGEALGRPLGLENDANAAALAEWRFGAGRGARDVVFLTMSTGVGGGLVLGGRLHRGLFSAAGEVGHLPVEWDGEPCACGQRGCLEAYVGGAAWAKRLAVRAPPDGPVARLAGGPEKARPEHVIAAARGGDAFAREELARFNAYLARGLVSLVYTLAPELFVLGTIAAAAGEELCFAPVRAEVKRRVWPFLRDSIRIVPSALGEELAYHAGLGVAVGVAEGER